MLAVLLESRAALERRVGGATFSIAAHLAILGLAAATTIGRSAPPRDRPEPVVLHFAEPVPPAEPSTTLRPQPVPALAPPSMQFTVLRVLRMTVPSQMPTMLPVIDYTHRVSSDSLVIGSGTSGTTRGRVGTRSLVDGDDAPPVDGWRGTELLMRVIHAATPRYPDVLRQAGIDGRVLVRFGIDTAGRVDMASVRVLASTHELFSRAVLDALPNFQFQPAQRGGHHVAALAEMPFEFRIAR